MVGSPSLSAHNDNLVLRRHRSFRCFGHAQDGCKGTGRVCLTGTEGHSQLLTSRRRRLLESLLRRLTSAFRHFLGEFLFSPIQAYVACSENSK